MKSAHIHLEFAPQARDGVTSRGLAMLILSALLLLAVGGRAAYQLYVNANQSKELSALNASRMAPTSSVASRTVATNPGEAARVQYVRLTSRKLTTPWADLLNAMETLPPGVALLTIDPSATKGSLTITGEASGSVEMLNYLSLLQSDTRLANVALASHQIQLQSPGTPVRFQIRATWGEDR